MRLMMTSGIPMLFVWMQKKSAAIAGLAMRKTTIAVPTASHALSQPGSLHDWVSVLIQPTFIMGRLVPLLKHKNPVPPGGVRPIHL